MTQRIFISYSVADTAFVARLAEALHQAGVEPLVLHDRQLSPGANFLDLISDEIKKSSAFVYVVSENSERSNYTHIELAIALGQQRDDFPIIPILLSGKSSLPPLLSSRIYIDFRDDTKFRENVATLARALQSSARERSKNSPKFPGHAYVEADLKNATIEIKRAEQALYEQKLRRQYYLTAYWTVATALGVLSVLTIIVIGKLNFETGPSWVGVLLAVLTTTLSGAIGFAVGRGWAARAVLLGFTAIKVNHPAAGRSEERDVDGR